MFLIKDFYEKNSDPDMIGIKCNDFDKTKAHKLHNEGLNEFVTAFVIHVVLQNVGL